MVAQPGSAENGRGRALTRALIQTSLAQIIADAGSPSVTLT